MAITVKDLRYQLVKFGPRVCRMETVGIRTLAGQAKVAGTVLCVGGSMLMTFYRGGLIRMWPSPIDWRYAAEMSSKAGADAGGHHMAVGAALVIFSCLAWAIWFIIQVREKHRYAYSI